MYTVKFYLDTNAKTKRGHPLRIETYCDKTKKQRRRSSGFYQKRKTLKMTAELTRLLGELIRELEKWKGDIDINDTTYQLLIEYASYKRQNSKTGGAMIQKTHRT